MSAAEELKTQLEAELKEKIKKMEKELENATMKAAGKHCCKNIHTFICICPVNELYITVSPTTSVVFCCRRSFYD